MVGTADNEMSVYVNGRRLGRDNRNWKKPTKFCIPKNTFVIGIKAKNYGGPGGISISFSNGQHTSTEWIYTTKRVANWAGPYVDDLDWKRAVSFGTNARCTRCPWRRNRHAWRSIRAGISGNAHWIWSNSWRHREVYFRFYFEQDPKVGRFDDYIAKITEIRKKPAFEGEIDGTHVTFHPEPSPTTIDNMENEGE